MDFRQFFAFMVRRFLIAEYLLPLKHYFLFLALVLVTFPASCKDETYTGKAVRISDGDTFVLLTPNQKQVKVRLYGIDAPEKGQDFGNVSRDYLGKLLKDKNVVVISKGKDQYGRIIGIVTTGSVIINEEILKAGLAWHFAKYDNNPVWADMEKQARSKRLGLWLHQNPIPPWEFRKNKRRS